MGFARGDRYERARPGYPPDALAHLLAALAIAPGARVLDLAAGTGKLTRHLIATGADVTAVEPTPGMREELAALAGVTVLDGRAEAIPADDGAFAAVTVAQAFHWFDGPAAVREIHRVLAPGGRLGLMWNVMDRTVPWVDALQERIHRHRGTNPWYAGHEWRSAFAPPSGFTPLRHAAFTNLQRVDAAGVLDRVASVSFIATLPDAARAEVLDDVHALVVERFGPRGPVDIPYVTDVFTAVRLD